MKSKYSEVIGELIKNERLTRKMTLRELADKASLYYGKKINHTSLMRYENEGRSMDIDVLIAILKAQGIEFGEFMDNVQQIVERGEYEQIQEREIYKSTI